MEQPTRGADSGLTEFQQGVAFQQGMAEILRRLESRAAEIKTLTAELAVCKRERTQQAQFAVKLEDELNELKEEREFLVLVIQHLQEHINSGTANIRTQITCTNPIHTRVRPYLA